jgi:hypothetical protein
MKRELGSLLLILVAVFGLLATPNVSHVGAGVPESLHEGTEYGEPQQVGNVECLSVVESSGLAASQLRDDLLWTHNDSGDDPRLYALNLHGQHLGTCMVQGANAVDWEDMTSLERGGVAYLLVADTGDNERKRESCQLYVIREQPPENGALTVVRTIDFQFEGGPTDCEAVAYDSVLDDVILVGKAWSLTSIAYLLEWPAESSGQKPIAHRIGELPIPGVTGMDISPDGSRAILATYTGAVEYRREGNGTWKEAFARPGHPVRLPLRKQGETICYASDGRTLFLTSESRRSPLFKIGVRRADSNPFK